MLHLNYDRNYALDFVVISYTVTQKIDIRLGDSHKCATNGSKPDVMHPGGPPKFTSE